MSKPEAVIRRTFHNIYPISFRIKKKQLDRSSFNRKLFIDLCTNLKKVEIRRDHLMQAVGIDVTAFEDLYFHIIEGLLNLSFNKEQLKLLHTYLYELSPNEEWDGYIELKIGETTKKYNIKEPKDVWDVLQKIA
tara:strand:+ start:100 stop:501 length:402 start_codon:yes stop_codon:yes gene_type:complete